MRALAVVTGSSRDFKVVAVSRASSELGTWLAYVGLMLAVYDQTHSARWVSALLLVDLLPATFVGILFAPLLDRLDRRRVLVACEVVGGVCFAVLAFRHDLVTLMALAAVVATAGALFRPGLNAAVPQLVSDDDLAEANALLMALQTGGVVVGPPIAGAFVGFAGVGPVFAANAVSYIASAALLATVRTRLTPETSRKESYLAQLRSGLGSCSTPPLRGVLAGWTVACVAWALVNVCEVLMAKQVFGVGDAGYGVLAACSGVGLVFGSLAAPRVIERVSALGVFAGGLALAGILLVAAAYAPWFWLTVVLFAAGAVGNAASVVGLQVLVQRLAEGFVAQAFGVVSSVSLAAAIGGMVGAGLVAHAFGARAIWAAAGCIAIAAAGIAFVDARERAAGGFPVADVT